jgi:redox-sensitive bicupin YhaK (pirin superfamily)
MPPARPGTNRTLYVFRGDLRVGDRRIAQGTGVRLRPDAEVALSAEASADALVLQGRPIGEPVVQHGPVVMNTRAEIQQAFVDYQRTRFGGWPWPTEAPTHGRDEGRFARHADGHVEKAD